MFKVIDGRVKRVLPIFGRKVFNRDGSVGTFTDEGVEVEAKDHHKAQPTSERGINPKGYK